MISPAPDRYRMAGERKGASMDDLVSNQDAMTDSLLLAARAGDRAAFDEVVRSTCHELRLFIAARVWDPDTADELVQATYVQAYGALPRYQDQGRGIGWLKGIARHLLLRERERRSRLQGGDVLDAVLAQAAVDQPLVEEGPAPVAARLTACLEQLSPRIRTLLISHHVEGRPLAILARQFRQRAGTLAMVLLRGRAALRACLERP